MYYRKRLMTLRMMTVIAAIVAPLIGCSTAGSKLSPQFVTPNIPAVPADVEACRDETLTTDPRNGTVRKLTAGEMERLWKTDRRTLIKVSACFERVVCQYHDVRKDIGGIDDEPLCVPTEEELRNGVPNIRKGRREPIPKRQKRME